MGEYFDTLILGATFLGLGVALSKNNCAVIESGGLFGAEFVNSYKVNKPEHITVKTPVGTSFLTDLRKRGLVYEDLEIYQAPAVYVLSKFLKEKPVDIRLMTEVISIKKEAGSYDLTLYNMKGFNHIKAKRLIDTTALGKGHKTSQKAGIKKSLNAVIHNPSLGNMEGLFYNKASELYTYTLAVPMEVSRRQAIEKYFAMENDFLAKGMKISSVAPEFSYAMPEVSEKIDDDFLWYPSAARKNLAAAFDEGVCLGESIL